MEEGGGDGGDDDNAELGEKLYVPAPVQFFQILVNWGKCWTGLWENFSSTRVLKSS